MGGPTLVVDGADELRVFSAVSSDVFYRVRVVPTPAFEFVAAGITALTGYTPDDHYADVNLIYRLLHPDDRASFDPFRDSTAAPIEMRWLRKDGTVVWVEHVNRVLRDKNGRAVAIHGVVRDVTERHRCAHEQRVLAKLGEALTCSLERDRMLREVADIMLRDLANLCIVDLVDGDVVKHVAIAHDDESVRRAIAAHVPDLKRPFLVGEVVASDRAVLVRDLDELVTRDPGRTRATTLLSPVSYIGVPLRVRGRLLGILNLVTTDRARRYDERHLILAEEIGRRISTALDNVELFDRAQSAVRARDQVLGVVAHDLRNPMGTIALAAGMLAASTEGKTHRMARMIQRAVKRADQLIADLLDEQRLEQGRLRVCTEAVWPDVLVLDALDAMQTIADHAQLKLSAHIDDGLPLVMADPERIGRVFSNLLGNAVKFTPRGGSIKISATLDGDTVRFGVADSGPGIDAEHVARLFEPYWQRDPTDARGLGLGLTIANQIVIAHESKLEVESKEGFGTVFSFALVTLPTVHDTDVRQRHVDGAFSQVSRDAKRRERHG